MERRLNRGPKPGNIERGALFRGFLKYATLSIFLSIFSGTPLLQAQTHRRLTIEPIDFQWNDDPEHFPSYIRQIESWGDHIYIRSRVDCFAAKLDVSGKILQTIGSKGQGPGEIAYGILAMAVWDEGLWIVDEARQDRILHFVNGAYQGYIAVDGGNIFPRGLNSNVFAASPKHIVHPAYPRSGSLAHVYTHDGAMIKSIGQPLINQEKDLPFLRKVPEINDTNWVFDGRRWHGLIVRYPVIYSFDNQFNALGAIDLNTPRINDLRDEILNFEPNEKFNKAIPLFSDFKARDGKLYAMCRGFLHEIDADSGTLRHIYTFMGKGEDFAGTSNQLNIHFFTILDNGDLILANAVPAWNHDLWRVPSFAKPIR